MKNRFILSIGLMLILNPLLSKRLEPTKVNSVLHNGKEYSINHSKIGTVLVREKNSKKEKIVTVYTIDYDPNLEKDIQDVFIKSIKIYNQSLLIQNERGVLYEMNLETYEVKKIGK
jgi:hypothetical protein